MLKFGCNVRRALNKGSKVDSGQRYAFWSIKNLPLSLGSWCGRSGAVHRAGQPKEGSQHVVSMSDVTLEDYLEQQLLLLLRLSSCMMLGMHSFPTLQLE